MLPFLLALTFLPTIFAITPTQQITPELLQTAVTTMVHGYQTRPDLAQPACLLKNVPGSTRQAICTIKADWRPPGAAETFEVPVEVVCGWLGGWE
jgi:hypothetical protein